MDAQAPALAHASHMKRERSSSALQADGPPAKAPFQSYTEIAAPLLAPAPLETKAAYFSRLRAALGAAPPFSLAHDFSAPGVYLYKRPVRSVSPQHAALLVQGGSVFHHVVVYIQSEGAASPVALEFGPGTGGDAPESILEAAPAAFPLKTDPELPEAAHLPMVRLAGADGHHPLTAGHVQRALAFAAARNYHVISNNCIAFADFVVRVLTGGAVRNAPLIFDALAGSVPAVDSPMLPMLQLMTGMGWHALTDGGRLMAEFLAEVGAHAIFPPGKAAGGAEPALEDAGGAVPPGEAGGGDSGSSDATAAGMKGAGAPANGGSTSPGGGERSTATSPGPRLPPRRSPAAAIAAASPLRGA